MYITTLLRERDRSDRLREVGSSFAKTGRGPRK